MKKIIPFFFCLISISSNCLSQQWRFPIAFEDAIGAKDTIWCIWDSTAHGILPVDTTLGEGAFTFNPTDFNVWVYNNDNDSTKTIALPYNGSFDFQVWSFNYQYPITINWDSTLFHIPLPMPVGFVNVAFIGNDYFYFVNNDNNAQAFNMLWDNHADAPFYNWGAQSQFPMHFRITRDPMNNVFSLNLNKFKIFVFPNPFINDLMITSVEKISSIEIFSTKGQLIYSNYFSIPSPLLNFSLSINDISSGLYIIKFTNSKNQIVYEKLLKTN